MIIYPIFLRCVQYSARNTKIIADSIRSLPLDTVVCLDWVGRTLSLFSLYPCGRELKGAVGGVPPVRASDEHCFIVRVLRAQGAPHPWASDSYLPPNLARGDLTGGADLGARPPAAGSLHRAGCEDGRAGQ